MSRLIAVCFVLLASCAPVRTVRVCSAEGCGAGFVNERGGVTTAQHVIASGDVSVSTGLYRAESVVIREDIVRDVAEVTGIDRDRSIRYCDGYLGDEVTAYVRSSQSIKKEYRAEIVYEGVDFYVIAGYHASHGHSGSPVLRDRGDCVIGIVTARFVGAPLTRVAKVKKGNE